MPFRLTLPQLTDAVKKLIEDAEVSTVGLSLQRNVTWGGDGKG